MESEVGLTASPVGISRGTGCRTKDVVSDGCSCSSFVGIGLNLKILSGYNSSCNRLLSASFSCPFLEVVEWQEHRVISNKNYICFIVRM